MTPAPPSVSVVIPSRRGAQLQWRSLEPILSDPATREVVIVLDGPPVESFEDIRAAVSAEPRVVVQEHDVPIGPARARQYGLDAVGGDIVLFLDDDVHPASGLASGHAAHHAEANGIVVVGYLEPVAPDDRKVSWGVALYARDYEHHCRLYDAHPERVLTHLWAGNVSLARDDCLRVGFHSPAFYCWYQEDRDFGLRCLKAGLRGIFDRSLAARHLRERSFGQFVSDARSRAEGRHLVLRTHPDVLGAAPETGTDPGLPQPLAALARLGARPWLYPVAVPVLRAAIQMALRLRLRAPDVACTKLLERLVQERALHASANGDRF